MPDMSFDFQQYIDERRGRDDLLAHEGAAYAYPGDRRFLQALKRVTPVNLAVEATVRLWKNAAQRELLGSSVKVTEQQLPELHRITAQCAERLGILAPAVYVYPEASELGAHTFGTNEDAFIVVKGALVDHLGADELRFVIGHELGHIQNNHVVYLTALHYLVTSANLFVRWIITPALMALQSWMRRAEITCDRAGLICSGRLAPALGGLVKPGRGSRELAQEIDIDAYLEQLDAGREGAGRVLELFHSHPHLSKRAEALRLFAETHYFLKAADKALEDGQGKSLAWCDVQVKQLLSMFGGRGAAAQGAGKGGAA